MSSTRNFGKTLSLLLAGTSLSITMGSYYLYNKVIRRGSKDFLKDQEELSDLHQGKTTYSKDWLKSQRLQQINIKSIDHLTLNAYYIPASNPSKKVVLLGHGYGMRAFDMYAHGQLFHDELGFNILMPDARGHGQSNGSYMGFGWHDRLDYLSWINFLIQELGDQVEIVVLGVSMGGATTMMLSGEDLPSQVKVLIDDCGYMNVFDQLAYQTKRMYHLPAFPIVHLGSLFTKVFHNYSFQEACALKMLRKAKRPMLFIHGDKDHFVPYTLAYDAFEACKSNEKRLHLIKDATHANSIHQNPIEYRTVIQNFLRKHM